MFTHQNFQALACEENPCIRGYLKCCCSGGALPTSRHCKDVRRGDLLMKHEDLSVKMPNGS